MLRRSSLGLFPQRNSLHNIFFPCSLTFCMVPLRYFQFAWFWNSIIIIIIFLQSGSSCYAAIRFISYKAKRTGKVFTQQEELGGGAPVCIKLLFSLFSFIFFFFLYLKTDQIPENMFFWLHIVWCLIEKINRELCRYRTQRMLKRDMI